MMKSKPSGHVKIDSRKIIKDTRSITPVRGGNIMMERKQSTQVSPLPAMNHNSSMQKLNNM